MRASGASGELRVGWHRAADLGPWSIDQNGAAFVLRAAVVEKDDFWFNERPIDVALHVAGVEWLWREADVRVDGDEIVTRISEKPIVEAKNAAKVAV